MQMHLKWQQNYFTSSGWNKLSAHGENRVESDPLKSEKIWLKKWDYVSFFPPESSGTYVK